MSDCKNCKDVKRWTLACVLLSDACLAASIVLSEGHSKALAALGSTPKKHSNEALIKARRRVFGQERCCACDEPTGKAGAGDDSLFQSDGSGPFCEDCWDDIPRTLKPGGEA